MRIRCLHGFFYFDEVRVGQISDFISYTGLSIVPDGKHFTFEKLLNAPKYALAGKAYLGATITTTFEGEPWQIFEANNLIYDFSRDLVVPFLSITQITKISEAGNKLISEGLILPGSLTAEGLRVKDYSAWFSRDKNTFSYSEVTLV